MIAYHEITINPGAFMLIKSERKEKPQLRAESLHFAHQSCVTLRLAPYQCPPPKKN